jgi:hypothetical protein
MLREILDQTATHIGREITNQPEVEAELRIIIAKLMLKSRMLPERKKWPVERWRFSEEIWCRKPGGGCITEPARCATHDAAQTA